MPVYRKEKRKWTKDGRSYYFRTYYTDVYGNKKQKESKLYKTKIEAKDAEAEFLIKIKMSDETDKSINFETVYWEWLNLKRHSIKSSTYYGLKHRTEKHILSFFKKYKLHSIKINIINNWLENMKNKELSLEYINTIISYLKELFVYAKENYEFDNKVVNKIHKYKIEVSNKNNESEWNFWTYEEFNDFIQNVDNNFYYLIFNFLYFTGLRSGEMIALTWNDVDFTNKTLNINKTFTNKVEDQIYAITDPKTKKANRIIDLDDNLIEILKEHYEKEKNIYKFDKNMFIFGNIKYVSPTTLARNLNKYIKKAKKNTNPNLKRITLHGFRHSHASLLFDLGCDEYDVAERLGDSIEVVIKIYYHMFPNKKSRTIKAINNFIKEKNKR